MILHVRGNGGSGKSTVVREVMRRYARTPVYAAGRRRPEGYSCRTGARSLFVVGHYETPCGGCDTIASPGEVYRIVRREMGSRDVLFEGIIVQDDVRRCVELHQEVGDGLLVIGLQVPLEICLASIADRRAARGDTRPLDPTNTTHRARSVERGMQRLAEAGVPVAWLSREEALARCLAELKVEAADAEPAESFGLR